MYWMYGGLNGDPYVPDNCYEDAYPKGEQYGGARGNPLFYHTKTSFKEIKYETKKAYLFIFDNGLDMWVAKKLCRELNKNNNTVYIHKFGDKIRSRVLEIKNDLSTASSGGKKRK